MSDEYRECPRCSPPPMRWPAAELVAALVLVAWCASFGSWLAMNLR